MIGALGTCVRPAYHGAYHLRITLSVTVLLSQALTRSETSEVGVADVLARSHRRGSRGHFAFSPPTSSSLGATDGSAHFAISSCETHACGVVRCGRIARVGDEEYSISFGFEILDIFSFPLSDTSEWTVEQRRLEDNRQVVMRPSRTLPSRNITTWALPSVCQSQFYRFPVCADARGTMIRRGR